MLEPPPFPTRPEIEKQLRGLLSGDVSRRDASVWAAQWVSASDPRVDDDVVWSLLLALVAADMIGFDRPYLYDMVDFEAWLQELLDAGVDSAL